ncbi:MAG TPA: AtpZ/AtpI family protein [Candidatus Saccharimonadales bacterium]|jgi:F0F1-type ATP synthase assembly protein I|nr:AtpZ/AtpI family protein [Candidatus Saccharimonadales bacterium]
MVSKSKGQISDAQNTNNGSSLLNATIQMSWKLAIVVLIPLIGGVKLDEHLKTSPYFTIFGSLLAVFGFGYVLYKVLADFNNDIKTKGIK